jgi:hypothetical protein
MAVASASAHAKNHWQLTLAADSPYLVAPGPEYVYAHFSAVLTNGDKVVTKKAVTLVAYHGYGCTGAETGYDWTMTAGDGVYTQAVGYNNTLLGAYSFEAYVDFERGVLQSPCVDLDVVATAPAAVSAVPRPDDGIFLCYSAFQDQPGVWPEAQAKTLLTQGYWYPYAVPDKVTGGTNIGGYHLTCNVAATQSVSGKVMGGDGTVLGSAYSGLFGYYPVVGK